MKTLQLIDDRIEDLDTGAIFTYADGTLHFRLGSYSEDRIGLSAWLLWQDLMKQCSDKLEK